MAKIIHFIIDWLLDYETYIDLATDIRTTSAAVFLVGGVGGFLGFTKPSYVIIISIFVWIICSLVINFFRRLK